MNKKLVAPLALLASVSLLTSCTEKAPVPAVPAVNQDMPAPVMQDAAPAPVAPVESTGTTEAATAPSTAPVVLTRTEVVTYQSPASAQDPVEFSVTVTDGVITAASATPKSDNEISQKLQTAFAADVSAKVLGKKAKDLDVDAIGGASLTTGAFETFVHSF